MKSFQHSLFEGTSMFALQLSLLLFWGNLSCLRASTFVYDDLHRITKANYGNGTIIEYSYDAAGNQEVSSVSDNRRTIVATVDPPSSGSITGSGAMLVGDQASLSATPASGFVFDRWLEGSLTVSTSSTLAFTVSASRTLVAKFVPLAPEIAVSDSTPTLELDLIDGTSSLAFSLDSMPSRTITVRNLGNINLIGISTNIDGSHAADFSIGSLPTTLAPAASANATISFAPSSTGTRNAVLHILSDDADEASFDIILTGPGLTQSQNWRQTFFHTPNNSGDAADDANPAHDGIANLMKFATNMDPTKPGTNPTIFLRQGGSLSLSYTRNKAAISDGLQFIVEWSDTLLPDSWITIGVTESTSDQGATEQVTAFAPAGTAQRRFMRLRVSR